MSMTPSNLFTQVAKAYLKYASEPYLREGQKWFAALYDTNRTLAMQVTGNRELDPFYKDDNLQRFITWITENSVS